MAGLGSGLNGVLASLPHPTQHLATALLGLGLGQPVRCVVAYSGGVDSSCLLHCAHQLQTVGLVQVVAAYVHHGWRGTPAPELPKLHKLTHQLNVPFYYLDATSQPNQTTENHARQQRYTLLANLMHQVQANVILTAHHQDDQLETLLFRLFRGTGLDGLEGIQQRMVWQNGHNPPATVLRPWLGLPRTALQTHADTFTLPTFNDPTNTETRHTRNALRHKVWPVIEEVMPQARASLGKLLQVVQAERSILNDVTQDLWHRLAKPATPHALPAGVLPQPNPTLSNDSLTHELAPKAWMLDDRQLGQLPTAYQWRVLRHWLKEHGCSPTLETVDKLQAFMAQRQTFRGKAPRLSLGNDESGKPLFALLDETGLRMVNDPEAARLATQLAREQHTTELPWPITQPLKIQLGWKPGWVLVIRPLPHHRLPTHWQKLVPNPKGRRLWVHLEDGLLTGLTVRTRRSGDRIQPLGYPQTTSVRRYFINQKVPLLHRDEWLCLANGNQVVWLPGLTVSEALWVDDWRWPTHEFWLTTEAEANDLTAFAGVDDPGADDNEDTTDADALVDADADDDDLADDDDTPDTAEKPPSARQRHHDDDDDDTFERFDDDDDNSLTEDDDNDDDLPPPPTAPAQWQSRGDQQRTYRRGGNSGGGGGRGRSRR